MKTREKLDRKAAKSDVLEREILKGWFAEVGKLSPAMSAGLQVMLPRRLTGDTAAEAEHLKWEPSPCVFVARVRTGERVADPSSAHGRALTAAGLPHASLHGLRRSFGSLSEWVECPVGIVAQIQGHKPSAIAEKHDRVRPLDLLRMWHQRIEDWILAEAGIGVPKAEQGVPSLRMVQ